MAIKKNKSNAMKKEWKGHQQKKEEKKIPRHKKCL